MSVSKCAVTQTSVTQHTSGITQTNTHTVLTSVLHLTCSAGSKLLAKWMDGVHVWMCIYGLRQIGAEEWAQHEPKRVVYSIFLAVFIPTHLPFSFLL